MGTRHSGTGRRSLSECTRRLRGLHVEHLECTAGRETVVREVVRWRAALACADEAQPYSRAAAGMEALFQAMPAVVRPDDLLAAHYGGLAETLEPTEWREELARLYRLTADMMGVGIEYPADLAAQLDELADKVAPIEGGPNAAGHHLPDYEQVLEKGFLAMADEADACADGFTDPGRAAVSRGIARTLRAFCRFAERHAEEAERLAVEATPSEAARLRAVVAACRRVPSHPARTFHEAVQAVWFVFFGMNVTEIPSANTLGRLDQILFPYYRADLEADRLDEDAAFELVAHLLLKAAGSSRGQALTVGGQSPDGTDATNDLTQLFLQAAAALDIGEPIVALLVQPDTDEPVLKLATEVTRHAGGQLTYYSQDCCRSMLTRRGLPPRDVDRAAINSCMGVVPAGREVSHMWGGVVFLPAILECVAAGGYSRDGRPYGSLQDVSRATGEYRDVEQLVDAYEAGLRHVMFLACERARSRRSYLAARSPNPFVSGVIDDCRARGRDRLDGGARYHSCICEGFGWANVSDSLIAVEDLVFNRGLTSLAELIAAARRDWEGDEALLREVRACPKYGNGDERADSMARRVLESFIDTVLAQRRAGEHIEYLPSLHTHASSAQRGQRCPVSFDGRRFGAALNKQLGPSDWAVRCGPTGVTASAARMPCAELTGGQALDISLPPSALDDENGRAGFRALLRTYFSLGGAQVQVNCVDADVLRDAQANPEGHRDLFIRIGGHCDRFVSLGTVVQRDLIARIEAGL